jgi:hypothetical protein
MSASEKEKSEMKNIVLREHDTILRDWERRASDIRIANCEYIHDENGRVVAGKAPNAKKVRAFYKKRDKFLRLRGKKH